MNEYLMEKDGAINIPENIKKMSLTELREACAHITQKNQIQKKEDEKRLKAECKTQFAI